MINERKVHALINSVIMVADKFIGKVEKGVARSKETFSDLQKLKQEALLLKQHLLPMVCPSCKSKGFVESKTGTGCSFCDGTVGGNPPKGVVMTTKRRAAIMTQTIADIIGTTFDGERVEGYIESELLDMLKQEEGGA